MTEVSPSFPWTLRLRYGALAALFAWGLGWLFTIPFEVVIAWRYVDGHARLLPMALAEGLLVWAAFSLFMAVAGFLPAVVPLVLLLPPRWLVRSRGWLIPLAGLAALVAIYSRMHILSAYYVRHWQVLRSFFFSGPNFFVVTFAVAVTWRYTALARRRLAAPPSR